MDELMLWYIDRTDGSMGECMDRWIDGWFNGWMSVGMNEWMVMISERKTAWARLD
jgi:hypothetical protein